MRVAAVIAALLIMVPAAGYAAESVADAVNRAVEALHTTSYEARMTYLSQFDDGELQQVYIVHVAPDLYHVSLLAQGQPQGPYYIENAQELVSVNGKSVTVMPKRRFSTNDALTAKFLRDLGSYPGSTILSGMVGDYDVWVVRQDATTEKPYVVTVGLDKTNYFPLFLLVNDAEGKRRVYYEMEAIEYKSSMDIKDELFQYPEDNAERVVSPRVNEFAPQQFDTQGSEKEGYSLQFRSPSAAENDESVQKLDLPLYPSRLPEGYNLEAISLLGCSPLAKYAGDDGVVYQFEVYGPRGDLLSIFQTHLTDHALKPGEVISEPDQHFVLRQDDGWLLAAFGNLSVDDLEWVLAGLSQNDEMVSRLLDQTKARDLIIQDVTEAATEAHSNSHN